MASEESREELEKEEYAASGGGSSDVAAKLQEIDQEDSSLLDSALGEGEGDGEVEGDESALSLLDQDETGEGDGDGDQLEDPVCDKNVWHVCTGLVLYCCLGDRGNQSTCQGNGRGSGETQRDARGS